MSTALQEEATSPQATEENLVQEEGLVQELRRDMEIYLYHRRYQKSLEGEKPVEEKIWASISKIIATVMFSWRRFVKRTFDVTTSAVGLVLVSPLMALIAVVVRLESRGPILFKQVRVGLRGKPFTMMKFRSMREDAEVVTGPVWAKEDDPRVTRIGKFMRKTHLDELPQLFNVLSGEMSLVGPRPERPHFVREFRKAIPHYDRRLCAKPGITGLAQVKRHYDETLRDVKNKLRYDVLYVEKMCPLLDVKVMALTMGSVFFGTGR